jgi:site-specific DNA-methyltransferase (adenine-specific)
VLKWGTGGINIDGCRVEGEPWKAHEATGLADKKFFTSGDAKVIQKEPHAQGRFPANLIHDGSQEVMDLFPETKSAVRKPSESGKAQDGWGLGARKPQERGHDDQGSAARFFYCPKASKKDRNEGCEELEEKESKTLNEYKNPSDGRTASKSGSPKKNHHPTVKPTSLMAYLCRLITPTGGVVLDPYMGSGSTGKAAVREGFSFVGIELDPDYYEICKARIIK